MIRLCAQCSKPISPKRFNGHCSDPCLAITQEERESESIRILRAHRFDILCLNSSFDAVGELTKLLNN